MEQPTRSGQQSINPALMAQHSVILRYLNPAFTTTRSLSCMSVCIVFLMSSFAVSVMSTSLTFNVP